MATDAQRRHDRTMATQTAPPSDTNTPPPSPSTSPDGNRFFSWMRGLGLTRQPGWIGGVCAGIAARLGIDPLIVRGIVVVVAVLGGPAFLLYAAAWLLLPDTKDKIHLEELLRGRLESPIAGIGALVLLSLLPVAQGFWYTGSLYWGQPSWGESAGRVLWTLVVLAAVVAFVVWVARRSAPAASEPLVTPATTDDRPDTIPQPVATATLVEPTLVEPTPPPAGAAEEDVAAWRAQQSAWKAEREAFRKQTAETARESARMRAQEARERTAAFTAQRAEQRRTWLAANPRAGAAYSAIALGSAALAGGIAVIVTPLTENHFTVGAAAATIVLGVAIALAGLLRRRSGFLMFVSVILLVVTLLSAVIPAGRTLIPGNYGLSNAAPGQYFQPAGDLYLTVDPSLGDGTIDVWQGAGTVDINLAPGTVARIQIVSQDGEVWLAGDESEAYEPIDDLRYTRGAWRSDDVYGSGAPTVTVRIWQGAGSIVIHDSTEPLTTDTPTDEDSTP